MDLIHNRLIFVYHAASYYLVNLRYPISMSFLPSHKSTHYHTQEFRSRIGNRQTRSYITIGTPHCAWLLSDALVFWRPVFPFWTRCQTSSLCANGMSFLLFELCTISHASTIGLVSCFTLGRMLILMEVLVKTRVMDLQVHLVVQAPKGILGKCLTRTSDLWINLEMTSPTACGMIICVINIESGNML